MHRIETRTLALISLAVLTLALPAWSGKPIDKPAPEIVGTSQPLSLVPSPEQMVERDGLLSWSETVEIPGASFLKAHLVDVNLRAGDRLLVRSASGRVVEEITGRGPKGLGSFWTLSAFGDRLVLELELKTSYAVPPFRVDQVIVGDADLLAPPAPPKVPSRDPESICAPADFEDVICYQGDAGKWASVLASVGVMSVGGDPNSALFCSGSNVSPLNYLLTNQHCIETQAECDTSEFVFKFYRTGCNNGSAPTADWQSFRCDQVVAQSPFIDCDQGLGDLDFTLATVIGDPASTFGFVDPDPTPLTDGEAIYIVQHPDGRPHEITHGCCEDVDADGTVLRYYDTLDTEGGSSGSPIFRDADDKLVGLHHCGGCSTPGTGNRGMLMSDIYPLIEEFLCSSAVEVRGAGYQDLQQVSGNGDAILDPGETWQITPLAQNAACDLSALGVTADFQVNSGSAMPMTLLDTSASFGDVAPGTTAAAATPVRFQIGLSAPCGGTVSLDMVNLDATNGGPFDDAPAFFSAVLGEDVLTTLFSEDFAGGVGGWTVVDGGTGTGAAQTWTTDNPGGRTVGLTAPFAICDSDEHGTGNSMDEELISGVIDASGLANVWLQFAHDFNWYVGGADEQADVEVRSSATGGVWTTVASYSGASSSGTQAIDITAMAAADLQVRFHYYDAVFEWWWAVDDVFVIGSDGFVCAPANEIFADGFESGDTTAWSGTIP